MSEIVHPVSSINFVSNNNKLTPVKANLDVPTESMIAVIPWG